MKIDFLNALHVFTINFVLIIFAVGAGLSWTELDCKQFCCKGRANDYLQKANVTVSLQNFSRHFKGTGSRLW